MRVSVATALKWDRVLTFTIAHCGFGASFPPFGSPPLLELLVMAVGAAATDHIWLEDIRFSREDESVGSDLD